MTAFVQKIKASPSPSSSHHDKGKDSFFGAQAKLNIGKSNDKFEVEADRVADQVVTKNQHTSPDSFFSPSVVVQKKLAAQVLKQDEQNKEIQQKTIAETITPAKELNGKSVQNKLDSKTAEKSEISEDFSKPKTLIQRKLEDKAQKKEQPLKDKTVFKKSKTVSTKAISSISEIQNKQEGEIQKKEEETVGKDTEKQLQMSAAGNARPDLNSNFETNLNSSKGSGAGLSENTKKEMESGFGTDFSNVKVHTDSDAVKMNKQLGSQAFANGNHVYFNEGKFNPNSQSGKHLLAHELTHTVQQGGTTVRKKPETIQMSEMIQTSLLSSLIPDFIKDNVRHVPGYTLLTVVAGYDPLNDVNVDRNAINLIKGFMGLVPFGTAIFDKLQEYGIIDRVFEWVNTRLSELGLSMDSLLKLVQDAWDESSITTFVDVVTEKFTEVVRRVTTFATSLVDQIITWIKEALIDVAEPLLADNKAYGLIKKIIKYDPLRGIEVTATTVEILEDFLLLIGKETELEQMREKGTLQETADWLDTQVVTFMSFLGELRTLITAAWDAIQPSNLANIADSLSTLAINANGILECVWNFAVGVALKVLELVKKSLLGWLSTQASAVRGYSLIKVIIGKDPFTEEVVPFTIPNVIKGFMSLMEGGDAQYAQMEETGAVVRIVGQVEAAVATLNMTPASIIQLFTDIWNSLSIDDLIHPLDAFIRIIEKFGEPIGRLIAFVAEIVRIVIVAILEIMNFPFDLISNIINRAMGAIEDIKKDPIGFLKNILRAIRQGFKQFFDNIVTHLVGGLTGWLMSELKDANVPVLTDFSLRGVISWVLEVLGISMEKIWEKLAAHPRIGPAKVARIRSVINTLEGIWTFIKDVQERGIAAIWDKIQEQLSNLWNTVLDAVKNFVMEQIINRITARLLSMLDPTGIMAVINGAMALYSAIQSFIKYLREMLEVVNSFVNGVADVAKGNVTTAANYLENTMGRAMPIVIGFLANQVGLSGIGARIGTLIESARALVDEALTWLVNKAVDTGMNMLDRIMGRGGDEEGGVKSIAKTRLINSLGEDATVEEARSIAAQLFTELQPQGLHSLKVNLVPNAEGQFYIDATASPLEHLLMLRPAIKNTRPAVTLAVRLTLDPQQTFQVATENRELMPGFVRPYVSKGQPGIDSGTVESRDFPSRHPESGSFSFASISTGGRVSGGSGGAILIPSTPSNIVELLTWSNGGIQTNVCHNDSHAEHQFVNWFNSQSASFIAGIKMAELRLQPLSPCAFCVTDLIQIRNNPNVNASAVFSISWTKAFKSNGVCHELDSTVDSLNNLQSSGWGISGEMPDAQPSSSENLAIEQV